MQLFVYIAIILRSPAKVSALNSSMIVVNLLARKENMGKINGAAMTLQSGGRALGPLLSGSLWALTVTLHFTGQQFISFVVVAVALATAQVLYVGLKLPEED